MGILRPLYCFLWGVRPPVGVKKWFEALTGKFLPFGTFLETDSENNTQAVLVGSRVRLNQTKNWSRYKLLLCLEVNKPNKQNVYEINFPNQLTSLCPKIINGTD